MRDVIQAEMEKIRPLDDLEAEHLGRALAWVKSGAVLHRLAKPATPPQHLVSYGVVVDGEHILLVDHLNAGLWLPTGGHGEPREHPRDTAAREVFEELSLRAPFAVEEPRFLTIAETVGKTAGHIDVTLWYVLAASRDQPIRFDGSEFNEARWFHRHAVPLERTDPNMARFLAKHYS